MFSLSKKTGLLVLSAALLAQPASAGNGGAGEVMGTILGGLLGAVVGANVDQGQDKTAGILIGGILGAVVGNVVGSALDESDRRACQEAQHDSFRRPVGYRSNWDGSYYGSRTGGRGYFVSTREGYHYSGGYRCRDYESYIWVNGREERTRGTACERRDGSWYEVRQTEVRYSSRW